MVTEIGVHDDNEIARYKLKTVDVGRSKTEFAGSWLENDVVGTPYFLKLFGDFLGPVRRSIVDDDDFPVEVSSDNGLSTMNAYVSARITYCSRNVFSMSQQIMGRFFRSL